MYSCSLLCFCSNKATVVLVHYVHYIWCTTNGFRVISATKQHNVDHICIQHLENTLTGSTELTKAVIIVDKSFPTNILPELAFLRTRV